MSVSKKNFKIINHTADIGIIAYGSNISQVFINEAKGMFSLITNPDLIRIKTQRKIDISAPDNEALLVAWLNELLYLFETEHILFSKFEITGIENGRLKAICSGEKVNKRHELKREVKAATYHMLNLTISSPECKAQVIFDI